MMIEIFVKKEKKKKNKKPLKTYVEDKKPKI